MSLPCRVLQRNCNARGIQVIQVTGFNADPHAPYKALGDPILDPQELVYRTMKLDIPTRR